MDLCQIPHMAYALCWPKCINVCQIWLRSDLRLPKKHKKELKLNANM